MIKIIGAKGNVNVKSALKIAEVLSKKWKSEIVLLDAELVFGIEHLVSAYEHAKRAFKSNTNIAKTFPMEMLLYASGERQISKAIEKMGIKDGMSEIAIALIDRPTNAQISELLSVLKIERNDTVLMSNERNLEAFGITKKELSTVPKQKRSKLVLEKVAFVDLLK